MRQLWKIDRTMVPNNYVIFFLIIRQSRSIHAILDCRMTLEIMEFTRYRLTGRFITSELVGSLVTVAFNDP